MEMDGLMIETHIAPDSAWSDAKQQLTPEALRSVLEHLNLRNPEGDGEPEAFLYALRTEIDSVDEKILSAVAHRNVIIEKIALFKKSHNMTILQASRWQKLLTDRLAFARQLGLDETYVSAIYQVIHDRAIKIQSELMNPVSPKDPPAEEG